MLAGLFFASQCLPCPPIASLRLPRRVMALPWPCLAILGALLGFPGVAIAFPSCLPSAYRVTMSRFLSRLRPSWAFLPSLRILSLCRHSIGHLLGIPLHADQRLRVGFHGPLARLAYLLP